MLSKAKLGMMSCGKMAIFEHKIKIKKLKETLRF